VTCSVDDVTDCDVTLIVVFNDVVENVFVNSDDVTVSNDDGIDDVTVVCVPTHTVSAITSP